MDIETKLILDLIERDLKKGFNKQVECKKRYPKNQIEQILFDFYEQLKMCESPDCLDKFFIEKLDGYKNIRKFKEIIKEIFRRLELQYTEPKTEEDFQRLFFRLSERVCEESEVTLRIVKDVINSKYKDLIGEDYQFERYNDEYEEYVKKEIERIKEQLTSNRKEFRERYKTYVKRIESIKRTDIEEYAEKLNEVIIFGKQNWELVLYAVMSPFAPKIKINGVPTRNNLHVLLLGDISSAKSRIMHILRVIAPKVDFYNAFTKAKFEGISTINGIEEGVIDQIKDGVLLIPELELIKTIPYRREFLDNTFIRIAKGRGEPKEMEPNITIFGCGNPKSDFFRNHVRLRNQIDYKESELSRFDIFIPMINTATKNELILEKMNFFGENNNGIDLETISLNLATIASGMKKIKEVKLTKKQKDMIKSAYKFHNKELEFRPLLVLRDAETLCRLINVIACSNFIDRVVKDGVLYAKDKDVRKAISLWENLINIREQIYTNTYREILSIKDIIYKKIVMFGEIDSADLYKIIVENEKICKKSAFYDNLKELILEGKVIQKGRRDRTLVAV